MYTLYNSVLGIAFVVVAGILTFLMYNIWKYPFDHEKLKTSAPAWMIGTHRLLGLLYVLIYIYLMYQMVPRLWEYQIELPARTVVHLTIGMSIGAILVIKLTIVRFFKHMEAKLVPALGTALFVCTLLLVFLALPFSLREAYLSTKLETVAMNNERIERVRKQLPKAGIEDPAVIETLASETGLEAGRLVLTQQCTQCHDLRTALARPRTPMAWAQTVSRMANRSSVLNPITEDDQQAVVAYLIAVSPTLQETLVQRREQQMENVEAQSAAVEMAGAEAKDFDPEEARQTFETTCSQCHALTQVDNAPPASRAEAVTLVQRMVGNGLVASEGDLELVTYHLVKTYTKEEPQEAQEPEEQAVSDEAASEAAAEEPPTDTGGANMNAMLIADGEALYKRKACIACHGVEGREPIGDRYPKLAGQNKEYLFAQLKDIKSRARRNGSTGQMLSVIPDITESDMEALAAYLESRER